MTTHVYTVCGKVRPQLCSNQLPGDCTILFVSPFHAAKLRSAASWAKGDRSKALLLNQGCSMCAWSLQQGAQLSHFCLRLDGFGALLQNKGSLQL